MGVYVKDLEMPTCCDICWALDEYGDYPRCRITGEQRGYNFRIREKRMDKCPLVPAVDTKVKWTDEGAVVTLEDHSDADVVEVLRCRDCKYFEIHVVNDYDFGEMELTSCAAFGIGDIHSDDYCSFGQRREEEHNAPD